MEGLVGEEADFEGNTVRDWKPVKFMTKRGDMIGALERGKDRADERVLDQLKSIELEFGKIEEERVAVVQVGGD